jgi:hypothetical protein
MDAVLELRQVENYDILDEEIRVSISVYHNTIPRDLT